MRPNVSVSDSRQNSICERMATLKPLSQPSKKALTILSKSHLKQIS